MFVMKTRCLALLPIILFICCTRPSVDMVIIKCDLDDISGIHESGLINDVEIVQLQDTNVYITQISKVESMDSNLYILDSKRDVIHIFTEEGKYINTISHKGHGANEYLELNDFFVDRENHTVNVLSRLNKKLFVYDKEGKNLLRTETLPKTFFNMTHGAAGYIGYSANYIEDESCPDNFWLMDKNFALTGHYSEINENLSSSMSASLRPFSRYNGATYMITQFSNEVNVIFDSDTEVQPAYMYDFGKYNLPDLSEEDYQDDMIMFKVKNLYVTNPLQVQETAQYLLALVRHNGQEYIVCYDKRTHEVKTLSLDVNKDKYFFSLGNVVNMFDEGLYASVEAKSMYDCWLGYNEYNDFREEYSLQVQNLRQYLKTVDPDGNPFLVIYKFKE